MFEKKNMKLEAQRKVERNKNQATHLSNSCFGCCQSVSLNRIMCALKVTENKLTHRLR